MSVLESLKRMVGADDTQQVTMEQPVPAYQPSLPETAQGMQLMRGTDTSTFELGQLALDSEPDIEQFKSFLRGYRIEMRQQGKEVVPVKIVEGIPAMNDDGISFICGLLRNYSGKSFLLTNYASDENTNVKQAKEDIRKRVWHAGKKCIVLLSVNRVKWQIDEAKRPSIANQFVDIVEASMMRSLQDGTARKFFNTQKHVTHTTQSQSLDQAPKKPWSFIGG